MAEVVLDQCEVRIDWIAIHCWVREAIVACDDAISQLRVRDGELSRARAEVDKLEEKIIGLETDVASLRAEADGAASHAKEVGRSYQIKKDE